MVITTTPRGCQLAYITLMNMAALRTREGVSPISTARPIVSHLWSGSQPSPQSRAPTKKAGITNQVEAAGAMEGFDRAALNAKEDRT